MATFTFASGVMATLEASWTINAPRKTGPSPKQNAAVLAAGAPDWVFERQSEAPFVPASPFPLTHLIDCLETNRQVAATIQEARRSLVVAMAADESARQSRPIHLSW